jgi:hypothetical protein
VLTQAIEGKEESFDDRAYGKQRKRKPKYSEQHLRVACSLPLQARKGTKK